MGTHVQDTSHKRLLLLVETDTAGSLDVRIFNIQISCAFYALSDQGAQTRE